MNMIAKASQEDLRTRDFLTLKDFAPAELEYLIDMAAELKAAKQQGREKPMLQGKVIALIFEKDSTRTRCAFEVAALHQGAHTTYLGPEGSHIGGKESVADTAQVLSGMFDAIQYRGFSHKIVEELAQHASVPVYNGLTDEYHPTQILADFLTITECSSRPLKDNVLTYVGDGANNMAHSLLLGAAKLGLDFRIACPKKYQPCQDVVASAHQFAETSGAKLTITDEVATAVSRADFVYTDVWLSMGQAPEEWDSRVEALLPYRVDQKLLQKSGKADTKFLHCLPAYHDRQTALGAKFLKQTGLKGIEVSHDVFDSPNSVVFQQSENRLHTIKALMVATLR